MKNITIALDDATYRNARIAAARRDASVSALVKQYLITLATTEGTPREPTPELETLLSEIAKRHPGFSCRDNLPRDTLYDRQ
jgi:hypothetical protein